MEGTMKKILVLAVLCFGVLPVFAACKVDGPCSANILDNSNHTMLERDNKNNLENNLRTEVQQDRNRTDANPFVNNLNPELNPNPNYNANCQFGICLPERSFSEIIDVQD